jgi:fatty-acyl-CoA synthase
MFCIRSSADHLSGERVNSLAKGLFEIGIKKGDKVSLWMSNRPEWMIAKFAIAKIGAILVPINTRYKTYELEYILMQSDSTTLILIDKFLNINYMQMIKEICPELETCPPGKLQSPKLPLLKNVVILGKEGPKGCFDFYQLMENGAKANLNGEVKRIQQSNDPEDVVNIQYTSGTTGFPKGAMLSHNMYEHMVSVGKGMHFSDKDCLMIPNPFFHVFGSICGILLCVAHGGTIATIEYFDPEACLKMIERAKATAIHGVPTMFLMQLEHANFKKYDVSSLRTGVIGGSSCPVELMKRILKDMHLPELTVVYGITETSSCTTQSRIGDSPEIIATTVGKPLPFLEGKIVDTKSGNPLPPGQPGEFCARGPMIMKGYYKMPEETIKAIDEEGWFHTGDILVLREDGNYKVTGRVKEMYIVGGENTYPVEIENFLSTHPDIKQVYVVGVPDNRLGEVGKKRSFNIAKGKLPIIKFPDMFNL